VTGGSPPATGGRVESWYPLSPRVVNRAVRGELANRGARDESGQPCGDELAYLGWDGTADCRLHGWVQFPARQSFWYLLSGSENP
jgi:hypothetical protein